MVFSTSIDGRRRGEEHGKRRAKHTPRVVQKAQPSFAVFVVCVLRFLHIIVVAKEPWLQVLFVSLFIRLIFPLSLRANALPQQSDGSDGRSFWLRALWSHLVTNADRAAGSFTVDTAIGRDFFMLTKLNAVQEIRIS